MNNGRPNLAVPGRMNIGVQHLDGPNAHPAMIPLQQPGAMQIVMVGGESRLEKLTGQIVAQNPSMDVARAVEIAREIIVACADKPPEQAEGGLQTR